MVLLSLCIQYTALLDLMTCIILPLLYHNCRRRAQEDAGAVFSQIVSVESGGTKEFQYF